MKRILGPALVLILWSGVAFADCENTRLTEDDRAQLQYISDVEAAAGMTQTVIAVAPVLQVLTAGSSLGAFFAAGTADLEAHVKSISVLERVRLRKIQEILELHKIEIAANRATDPDPDNCRIRFFEQLSRVYSSVN